MTRASEILMHEHRVIESVLGSLVAFGERAQGRAASEREAVRDFAEFFSGFADRCHHGKEEERLFVRMVERGLSREQGPVAVMLAEHSEGREHVGALRRIGEGEGPLSAEELASVRDHAAAYASLLFAHIQKEDNVLYPIAERVISAEEMDRLAADFDEFEQDVMGESEHERYHALAERLTAAWRRGR